MRFRDETRVLGKCSLLAMPLLALVIAYAVLDPFMVVRPRADYYAGQYGVFPNRDWVSTRLLPPPASATAPDSFIFGNSRSMAFETDDWRPYLPPGSRPYHFDASLESLFGVWSKVRYLDDHGYRLRNVLWVVDADLLRQAHHGDQRALFRKTPSVDGSGWVSFHLAFLEAFLSRGFFLKYLDFVWSGHHRPYMDGAIDRRYLAHRPESNDLSFAPLEAEIEKQGEQYHRSRASIFDAPIEGAGTPTRAVLLAEQRRMLQDLERIFAKQGTAIRIVVSPLYDRRPLALSDRAALQQIFGRANVFDYSGSNAFTEDRHNYYEASHYRIGVARNILRNAYASESGVGGPP